MADPRAVEYIRANQGKFPPETLKAALLKAGLPEAEADAAFREAAGQPAAPAAPAPAPPAAAEAAPAFAGILAAARAVLLDPRTFYRTMPREGGWAEPMLFLMAMAVATAAIGATRLAFLAARSGQGTIGLVAVGSVVVAPVFAVVLAAVYHVVCRVLGSEQGFETSLRCVAYSTAVSPIGAALGVLPGAGPFLALAAPLYRLYLLGAAACEAHGLPRSRVVVAVLVMIGLAVLAALALVAAIFGMLGRWH